MFTVELLAMLVSNCLKRKSFVSICLLQYEHFTFVFLPLLLLLLLLLFQVKHQIQQVNVSRKFNCSDVSNIAMFT